MLILVLFIARATLLYLQPYIFSVVETMNPIGFLTAMIGMRPLIEVIIREIETKGIAIAIVIVTALGALVDIPVIRSIAI